MDDGVIVHRAEAMPGDRSVKRLLTPIGYGLASPADDPAFAPEGKILLHSCCAPCSGAMFEDFITKGLDVTVFFYNPNIHPKKEYEIRKEENKRFCQKNGVPFVDCDYDADAWFSRMKGLDFEPERGIRCTACFDLRMEVTALYAHQNGFATFTTTNAASRWKDLAQVNESGRRAAAQYRGLHFWAGNWQTDAMTTRKYEISASERFYKQEYCGCAYSLRDSNIWRQAQGIPPCKIGGEEAGLGGRYFADPVADAEEESQEVVDQFFSDAARQFDSERLQKCYADRRRTAESLGTDVNNW
jgi:predicted adenine nucleotide alpha hydrolase (AANH) superfamily ATPase